MSKKNISIGLGLSASMIFSLACGTQSQENPASVDKPAAVEAVPKEPLKITVSKNGYEPKSISVKKGQAVKLAFQRTDEENCGEELVFPNLNIKKNLPVGETVMVEFTPPETGELGFTCGMNMLRGKVIVQ